jgi:hypothetical protein
MSLELLVQFADERQSSLSWTEYNRFLDPTVKLSSKSSVQAEAGDFGREAAPARLNRRDRTELALR